MLTAVQKIRLALTGNQFGEPHFQHEGEEVIRWITGGMLPDSYATFHQRGMTIEVRCPSCHALLGCFSSFYRGDTVQQLASMRQIEHTH